MALNLESRLKTWVDATVIDLSTAERIRTFEAEHASSRQSNWMVIIAVLFGAVMLGAGVLLFVAAHWDQLSPTQRFLLVLLMVASFHVAGGLLIDRSRALGIALHAVGTLALGGGIFLAGQIFNLEEHWPGGIMLWAAGAVIAWLILGDNVQAILSSILVPFWIASELALRGERIRGIETAVAEFVAMVAVLYLSAPVPQRSAYVARAMNLLGALAFIPAVAIISESAGRTYWGTRVEPGTGIQFLIAVVVYLLPLLAAWLMRGHAGLWNVGFALYLFICSFFGWERLDSTFSELAMYGWWALGAIALVWWGVREASRMRINLGVLSFALTVVAFYFSSVMDKLGRSASLISFGAIFLLGGWYLEKFRRKLVLQTRGGAR